MRRLFATLGVLLLAGCGVGGPEPLPTASARAVFRPGDVIDTITVTAIDRLPLKRVELVAPNGAATPADTIDIDRAPTVAGGQFALNDPWRTGFGGGLETPIRSDPQAAAALRSQERLLMIVASAAITLPDAPAYRRDWRRYRIRLGFGVPDSEMQLREIPAPPPPPK